MRKLVLLASLCITPSLVLAADWPQQLYGKLGFDPVGTFRQFTKPPPGQTDR